MNINITKYAENNKAVYFQMTVEGKYTIEDRLRQINGFLNGSPYSNDMVITYTTGGNVVVKKGSGKMTMIILCQWSSPHCHSNIHPPIISSE